MKKKSDGTVYDDEYGKPITIHSNCWIARAVLSVQEALSPVTYRQILLRQEIHAELSVR